jgi:hypothetical protein
MNSINFITVVGIQKVKKKILKILLIFSFILAVNRQTMFILPYKFLMFSK